MQYYPNDAYQPASQPDFIIEPGGALDTANEVKALLKKAYKELDWFAAGNAKSSEAVAARWSTLKAIMEALCKPVGEYYAPMLEKLAPKLAEESRCIDEANVDYEGADDRKNLEHCLDMYADVLLGALKRDMTEEEAREYEW